MREKDSMVELRKRAEKIVADMPEGELKLKAFEVAFKHLLETTVSPVGVPSREVSAKKRRRAPVAQEAPELRGELPKRIFELRNDEFFREPRTGREVQRELKTRGFHYAQAVVQMALLRMTRRRLVRRVQLREEGKRGFGYVEP